MENEIICKYCGSEGVSKYGTYKGVQRYFCKSCERKFKADDTTFHMKTPTNQVTSALNMYYEGMSIKAIRRNLRQEQGNMPSTATIYEWIQKYTQYATDSIKEYKPNKIGDTWIADETVLEIDGNNVWMFDIIDDKTRFILATRITRSRTTRDAQALIDKAIKTAGKEPKTVITDSLASYLDVRYGKDAEHIQGKPFAVANNTQKIERWHSTLKTRTKVMRGLKNFETATEFVNGWLVHYNYLRPHTALDDKTPAEVAGVDYPYKNWADIIRKHIPSGKIAIEHQPRGRVKLPPIQIGRTPKYIRTPKLKAPKLSNQVLVQQTKGGSTLLSRRRVKGTRLVGRYGRGR
ncbi:DDE-type integrase/transposase/recombinase [Chloroflexota bacterium]